MCDMLLERQFTDRDCDLGHEIDDVEKPLTAHQRDIREFSQITVDVFDADSFRSLDCLFLIHRPLQNLAAKNCSKVIPVDDHGGGTIGQTAVQALISERRSETSRFRTSVPVTFKAFRTASKGSTAIIKTEGGEIVGISYWMAVRISNDRGHPGHFRENLENSLQFLPADQVQKVNRATHNCAPPH